MVQIQFHVISFIEIQDSKFWISRFHELLVYFPMELLSTCELPVIDELIP